MGIFDLFGGGTPAEKALKLKAKVTQKYGDPLARAKAIQQLGELKVPEAAAALLARFLVTVEPQTTDAEEKESAFELICELGDVAIAPVQEFMRKQESATSWALRILERLYPKEQELVGFCVTELQRLGSEYTRDPEKKTVLMHFLEGKTDERIAPSLLPFLEDMSDEVKIAALRGLGPLKLESAREPMLSLLTSQDTARRAQVAGVAALEQSGFGVQGYREKVESLLPEAYFVDKAGLVHKRP